MSKREKGSSSGIRGFKISKMPARYLQALDRSPNKSDTIRDAVMAWFDLKLSEENLAGLRAIAELDGIPLGDILLAWKQYYREHPKVLDEFRRWFRERSG